MSHLKIILALFVAFLQLCLGSYFDFIPTFEGFVSGGSPTVSFTGKCFKDITVSLSIEDASNAKVNINCQNAVSALCSEIFLIASRESFHLQSIYFHGTHDFSFKLKDAEADDLKEHGYQVFIVADGALGAVSDLIKTISLFDGAKQTENNVKFIQEKMNVTLVPRADPSPIVLDSSLVHAGDYLAIRRLDGLDPVIMWGTGGLTGHTAVVVEIDGQLYITESTDVNPFGKAYWPPPYGIIATPYAQWMQQAQTAGFDVALLPLAAEMRARFNNTAAVEFYQQNKGTPYGNQNFIMGWIDTAEENFPSPLSSEMLMVLASVLDRVAPAVAQKYYLESFNLRLGTVNYTMEQVFQELDKRGMSWQDFYVLPEQDSWMYQMGHSMVCSSYVVEVYKAAGLFDDINRDIQGTEQTPKDTYQMALFDVTSPVPAVCQRDNLPYCQLFGTFRLDLPGVSTIKPYAHMNEKCPSMPPLYLRPNGC